MRLLIVVGCAILWMFVVCFWCQVLNAPWWVSPVLGAPTGLVTQFIYQRWARKALT